MSDWTVRPFTPEDVPVMRGIREAGFATYSEFEPGWRLPDEYVAQHEQRMRDRLDDPALFCLIAESEGSPIAHVALVPAHEDGERSAELWQLFVLPGWWGSGVAKELLDAAVAEARRRGFERMLLSTPRDHLRARRFYEREGWSWTGEEERAVRLGLVLVEYAISI